MMKNVSKRKIFIENFTKFYKIFCRKKMLLTDSDALALKKRLISQLEPMYN